eukprot:s483_g3.t1
MMCITLERSLPTTRRREHHVHQLERPDSVYFAAAEAGCLKLSDGDFEFEVCLFDRVTQRDLKSGKKFTLGKDSAWATTLWENGQHRTAEA